MALSVSLSPLVRVVAEPDVLDYWNNAGSVTSADRILIESTTCDGKCPFKGFERVSVENSTTWYYVEIPVAASNATDCEERFRFRSRRRGRSLQEATNDYSLPEDGAILYQGEAIVFEETTTSASVDCFVFEKAKDTQWEKEFQNL